MAEVLGKARQNVTQAAPRPDEVSQDVTPGVLRVKDEPARLRYVRPELRERVYYYAHSRYFRNVVSSQIFPGELRRSVSRLSRVAVPAFSSRLSCRGRQGGEDGLTS